MTTELKKTNVKSKVEAVLFSVGHKISLDEISKLCRARKEDVIVALHELKKEYDDKQSSLMLVEEGDFWKFTVRDHYISIVRKIVTETELTKSVLETLAVIAFKYPILQSDLIKIRTNKAYDHLTELESAGYISRQKHGRTNLIKLTEKFFRYFDLTEEKLKEQFKDFDSIAKAIKEKEEEIEIIKEEQRKKAEELKKEDEKIRKEIELLDKEEEEFEVPLETYETKPKELVSEGFEKEGNLIIEKEKIGEMEVVEEEQHKDSKQIPISENEQFQSQGKEVISTFEQQEETEPKSIGDQTNVNEFKQTQSNSTDFQMKQKKKSQGIKLTPEMETKVNKRVEEILHPEKENKEEK